MKRIIMSSCLLVLFCSVSAFASSSVNFDRTLSPGQSYRQSFDNASRLTMNCSIYATDQNVKNDDTYLSLDSYHASLNMNSDPSPSCEDYYNPNEGETAFCTYTNPPKDLGSVSVYSQGDDFVPENQSDVTFRLSSNAKSSYRIQCTGNK